MFGHPVPENIQNSHGSSSWPNRLFPSVPVSTASHLHACIPYTAPSSSTYRWFRWECVVPWVAWSRCGNSKCSCSSGRTAPTTRQSMSLISSIIVLLPIPHLDKSHKCITSYAICCVSSIPALLIFVCLNHTEERSIIILNVPHSSFCIFWNIKLFMYNIPWYTIWLAYTV